MLDIAAIDKAFAAHFLQGEEREDCYTFLCYLLASTRAGHLCIQEDENSLLPHPKEIWPEADETILPLLKSGLGNLPGRLISSTLSTPIFREGERIYLQKNRLLESEVIHHFHQLLEAVPEKTIDPVYVDQILDKYVQERVLTKGQANVIKSGCQHCLTIISGGPGTGKTYTAGHLIALLSQFEQLEIVLAAPTGKAAARLQNSIVKAAESPVNLHAKTLHSLLGVNKYREDKEFTLKADIVLIDESSMIDVKMMVRLFSSLKKGARLILLGDPYQLPPVEMGNLFADFVSYLSKIGRFTQLSECLRVENSKLIELATEVNRGESQAALHLLLSVSNKESDIYYMENESNTELMASLDAHFSSIEQCIDDISAIKLFDRFRILCPLRNGVETINRELDLKRKRQTQRYIPIILNRHAKEFDLFNGDTGVLVKGRGEDYALFEKENFMKIPAYLLPSYDLAYCLSVHKCQGSEYEQVFLVLPNGSQVFGRQSLYTAITRAKKKFILWGSVDMFKKMVETECFRLSGFEKRIGEQYKIIDTNC